MTSDKKEKSYSSKKIQAIEKKILAAVKKAKKAKLRIITCDWGVNSAELHFAFPIVKNKIEWVSEKGCTCPGGAVLLFHQPSGFADATPEEALASVLNVDTSFVDGFVCAVDNGSDQLKDVMDSGQKLHYKQGYKLGCKFHKMVRVHK